MRPTPLANEVGHAKQEARDDDIVAPMPTRMFLTPVGVDGRAVVGDNITDFDFEDEPVAPFYKRFGLFIGMVILPVLAGILYFGILASGLYVSETKFIVRSASSGADTTLSSLLHTPGLSRAVDETYAVSAFMTSRDITAKLEKNNGLRDLMSRPEADIFNRFPNFHSRDNTEQLYKAYLKLVDIDVDTSTGISTLMTRAYRPEDALALAKQVIAYSDEFINTLNVRAHNDSIAYAEALVKESNARLADVERRLAQYRDKEMILNPEKESGASMEILAKLSTEISRLEAALAQQLAQTPDSPAITPMREKIKSFRVELEKQRQSIAGGANSIASKLEGFERLTLERELAAKGLAAAIIELERSRQFAQTQRIYLQTIVEPNFADLPTRPRRLLSIIAVLVLSLCFYWIVKSLIDIVLEHQA